MWVLQSTAFCGVRSTCLCVERKAWSTALNKNIASAVYVDDLAVETIFFVSTYGIAGDSYLLVIDANTGDLLKDRIIISGPNGHVYSMVRYSDDLTNDR